MTGLLITNDFPPMVGGLATWYRRICATVPADSVLVLAPRLPGDARWDTLQAYRIIRCRVPTQPHPLARISQIVLLAIAALRVCRRERVDAVHIAHLHLGLVGLLLKRLVGRPYVLYLHGGEIVSYLRLAVVRRIVRRIVAEACLVVVNSSFTRRMYAESGMSHPRTLVLATAAPVDRFRPDADPAPARARYGLNGARVLLTVGRLVERKGHDVVLHAVSHLWRNYPDLRYVIAGSGPREVAIRSLTSKLGCEDVVVFAGHVPEEMLPSLYAACDVFVMPSRALDQRDGVEGFGIVFLEAAAAGKPVVGGRSGGIEAAVVDGVTGVLVDPTSVEALTTALDQLLSDPQAAVRFGQAGRARAQRLEARWRDEVRAIWRVAGEAG